ncbi:MAG: L,D-transpeptidase family protein [Pseudomonadota bacterium]
MSSFAMLSWIQKFVNRFVAPAVLSLTAVAASAEVTPFKLALAEAASDDAAIAEFYRTRGFEPIFTGSGDLERRAALLEALESVERHGLPLERYDSRRLMAAFEQVQTPSDRGRAEFLAAQMFVRFARDLQSGILEPRKVDAGIVREINRPVPHDLLTDLAAGEAKSFFREIAPQTPEYARLMKEKLRLERVVLRGGWGSKVEAKALEPGDSGEFVVQLRDRLVALGYLRRSASTLYDGEIQRAVRQFQTDHGLETDGVAGQTTITMLNVSAQTRLQQVVVAMERERWTNFERGDRHVLVNITDYTAAIIDDGKVTYRTRSVVGANDSDRRTPEFSDVMEHLVVNPTWNVPYSIATKEYLPKLQRNPHAVSHLRVIDRRGRVVNRSSVNFAQYSRRNFPFSIKQPPGARNALGLVKFMFPNKYNIYLHDTPAKDLFSRETRAYSHGCIRLNDPFDFAYALLAKQSDDPVGLFKSKLNSGRESRINLEQHVPVHLIYRTAVAPAKGRVNYRRDVYGRDARIFEALSRAGVALPVAGS